MNKTFSDRFRYLLNQYVYVPHMTGMIEKKNTEQQDMIQKNLEQEDHEQQDTIPNNLEREDPVQHGQRVRTIKDLINTPFKKAMFAVQILSYVLIVGSPLLGGAIGGLLGMKASRIGGLIFGIFLAGEVLFYGSLAFLGKEIVMLLRDKFKARFKRKKQS